MALQRRCAVRHGPELHLFASPAAAPYTFLFATVPQLPPQTNLGTLSDRLMFRLAYRNFGPPTAPDESLVANYTVSSGGVAGIRWFELKNVTNGPVRKNRRAPISQTRPGVGWGVWRWIRREIWPLASAPRTRAIHPQIRYALVSSTDPLNTLTAEAHLFDGTGSQSDTSSRWGDYSDMTVDPVDDCTFWYTQEYYATNSSFNWRTRIGNFKFGTCGAASDTVTITKAQYSIANSQLKVNATDSNPAAVLTVKVTSSGMVLGTMQSRGDGTYKLKKVGIANPVNITVTVIWAGVPARTSSALTADGSLVPGVVPTDSRDAGEGTHRERASGRKPDALLRFLA